MIPFTPARKQNMIAWMAARCDAPNYGQVIVFDFPKQKLVYGPQQIKALTQQANQQYQQALKLLRQGDWAGHGNEIKKLGETLNQLASQTQ